ncbi:LamG-like jellyroll fold domain-containing protein [Flavobacterium ginsengiterrae]
MRTKLLLLLLISSLSTLAQTLPSYVPANGLIAYYQFNGNANDISGNAFNGNVTSAVLTTDRFGNTNNAYSFNGVNSFIDAVIANLPNGNTSRTISGWFKTNDTFSEPNKIDVSIFDSGKLTSLQRLNLSLYSKGYLQMVTGPNAGGFYINNFNYVNDDWYFFTLTYDGTKLSIFVNGKFVDASTVNLNTVGSIFRIGQRISGDNINEAFKGTIDDIGIWNRVLTPEEISAMYIPGEQPKYTLIPDANFEQKLINLGLDYGVVDGKVLTSNIKKVTFLDVSKSAISDLTGIQDFASLTNLYCGQNTLKTLNVSKNTALTILDCNNNQITALDISNNIALTELSCYANKLTSLDVKVNTALTKLDCGSNQYTSLDISKNTALTFLGCNTSQLTTLDISTNTSLTLLDCRENKITSLDVSKVTTLTELYCQSNQLKDLNVGKNKVLEFINCSKNLLTTLDVSINTALVGLYANSNQLTSLNLKNGTNAKLAYLNLKNNPNLSCIQVDDISYFNANWASYKDSGATFSTNCLDEYTLIPDSNFEERLIMLGIDKDGKNGKVLNTSISKIDHLYVGEYAIKDLTGISGFTSLKGLNVSGNELTSLDLSKNTLLDTLDCSKNKLRTLNLKNGNNKKFYSETSNFSNNPDLTCIQVDDVTYANANWASIKDATAAYNTNCEVIYAIIPDSNFEQKLIDLGIDTDGLNGKITTANISSITSLDLSNSNIKNLTGIEYFTSLTSLDVSNNQITSLDLSGNLFLETLNASSNQLTTLDVSKNTKLRIVYVVNNPLVSLNLRNGNNANFILPSNTGKKSVSALYTSFLGLKTLGCIQVDNENYSNANWSNIKESSTIYSNTCKNLGVDESIFSQAVVYPNPTKGALNIKNVNLEKANVYNTLGQLVRSFTLNSGNTDNSINLSDLPKGIYYIYLINGNNASVKKIIVE